MAIPVARVHLAMAHAALPGLLPTPPKWKMMPLLPTPPCVLILPMPPPKPASRADADERWDARKNASKSPSKPGRADSEHRWDAHKMVKVKPCGSPAASSGRSSSRQSSASSSCERWDSNKTTAASVSVTSSSSSTTNPLRPSPKRASLSDSRRVSHASSAERWDAHKKPHPPPQADVIDDDDGQSSTGSNESMELDMPYAGPGFLVAAPEPSMLPMPSPFMVRVA